MIRAKVIHTWQKLSQHQRKELRRLANRARDAGLRCRCKVILALVRGTTPTMIAQGGLCAKSQVYRVAERFLTGGLAGLADRREDNGQPKITPAYQAELLRLVEESPQGFGYRRPTWTQELLVLVLAERVEISVSVSAMSRLLGRLGIGLKRPKPIVKCPWKEARRRRRLREIERLVRHLPGDEVVVYVDEVDIHLNPKVGPDWTRRGRQKEVLTPGCNKKRYLAGAWNPKTRRLIYVEGERKNSLLFLELLHKLAHEDVPQRQTRSCHPRQLRYPRQPASAAGVEDGHGREAEAPLPAAVLPGPQSDRADLEGSARQRHAQPSMRCRWRISWPKCGATWPPETVAGDTGMPKRNRPESARPQSRKAI